MVRFVENFQVAHFLFEAQREAIEELVECGACSPALAEELLDEVQEEEEKLDSEHSVGEVVRQVRASVRRSNSNASAMSAKDALAAYTGDEEHMALGHDPVRHGPRSTWKKQKSGSRAGSSIGSS